MKQNKIEAKTDNELLHDISGKLDRVIAIMATHGKTQDQQIVILKDLGFDWKTIGAYVGLKPDAARMRFSNNNKK